MGDEKSQNQQSEQAQEDSLKRADRSPLRPGDGSVRGYPSADQLNQRINAGLDRAISIACPDAWRDHFADHPRRLGICNDRLQAITNLDPDFSVLGKDEEDQAVIDSFSAHAPSFEGANRPVFGGRRLGRPTNPHQQLVARGALVTLQLGVQSLLRWGRYETRFVRDPAGWRGRHRRLVDCRSQKERCRRQEDCSHPF
jgi:hypothetical protein